MLNNHLRELVASNAPDTVHEFTADLVQSSSGDCTSDIVCDLKWIFLRSLVCSGKMTYD